MTLPDQLPTSNYESALTPTTSGLLVLYLSIRRELAESEYSR